MCPVAGAQNGNNSSQQCLKINLKLFIYAMSYMFWYVLKIVVEDIALPQKQRIDLQAL